MKVSKLRFYARIYILSSPSGPTFPAPYVLSLFILSTGLADAVNTLWLLLFAIMEYTLNQLYEYLPLSTAFAIKNLDIGVLVEIGIPAIESVDGLRVLTISTLTHFNSEETLTFIDSPLQLIKV